MFTGNALEELVAHLRQREASVYHACQLHDVPSYLALGGIPSHAHLEAHRARYTAMDTDAIDQSNQVWDKVFVNLSDFGCVFAQGGTATPTAYGPISFQLRPDMLLEAADVAICPRSAGAQGFDRERESLTSVDEVDRLFRYAVGSPFPHSVELKFGAALQQEFPYAHWPEVSCTVPSGRLSLAHVVVIWVDPYTVNGRPLREHVQELVSAHGLSCPVVERRCCHERRDVYDELAALAVAETCAIDAILDRPTTSAALRELLHALRERDLEYQLDRYLRYLRAGTLTKPRCTEKEIPQ